MRRLTFKFSTADVRGEYQTQVEINNNGEMVGYYQDAKGYSHGYTLNGKKLTRQNHPKGTNTLATGTNFNGPVKIVGSYKNSSGNSVGFRSSPAAKKFKDTPSPAIKGATSSCTGGIKR